VTCRGDLPHRTDLPGRRAATASTRRTMRREVGYFVDEPERFNRVLEEFLAMLPEQ
jgi:hypothetical protein